MSQAYLFQGFTVQKITVNLPIYGKTSVNPLEPPSGLEELFPDGNLPGYYDLAKVEGWLRCDTVGAGSKIDQQTGVSKSDFTQPIEFSGFRKGFQVVEYIPFAVQQNERGVESA